MPTPFSFSDISAVNFQGSHLIDPLIQGFRWTDAVITYSFPDTNSRWSADPATGYGPGDEPWSNSYTPLLLSNRSDFTNALQQWENVANITFDFIDESYDEVGDIRIAYTEIKALNDAEAWTYLPANGVWGGDIWINRSSNSAVTEWTAGSYSFFTMLHEIGHALGLEHPFDNPVFPTEQDTMSATVMSYSALPGNQNSTFDYYPTTPMPLDIKAMQYLYGAENTFHNGNNTYLFTDEKTYHETIWDSGGIDTLHYTGKRAAFIQLEEGQGSTVGNPVRATSNFDNVTVPNVWIAYGTVIENATGGNNNDIIYGNPSDNILSGQGGNDVFYGMGGNDIFLGGNGIDKVLLYGSRAGHVINQTEDGFMVIGPTGAHNQQSRLTDIERLSFDDTGIALDITGHAGQIAKLLGAVLGTSAINNKDFVKTGLSLIDEGMSYEQLATTALEAAGVNSHEAIVALLWYNLYGDDPTPEEQQSYIDLLKNGRLSPAELGLLAADSTLNADNINLIGLTQTGIEYSL